jgi:hypothetical protein
VKNEKGELVDLLKTYALQSRSNARAATCSAFSAVSAAVLFVHMLGL